MDYFDLLNSYEQLKKASHNVKITTSTTTIVDKRKVMSDKIKEIYEIN